MFKDVMCSAVIVAAGVGKRMGSDRPKQFLSLNGKTIIERTAAVFGGCNAVDEIILVSSENGISECYSLFSAYDWNKKVKYVCGGKERYNSVYNGIKAADKNSGIIIIHDGVRSFVTEKIITDSIECSIKARRMRCGCSV